MTLVKEIWAKIKGLFTSAKNNFKSSAIKKDGDKFFSRSSGISRKLGMSGPSKLKKW